MPADKAEFARVHERLTGILRKYEKGALKGTDEPGMYTLIGPAVEQTGKNPVWIGAVRTGKNYVSFHFMPLYGCGDLVRGLSPALKKRMQGKSCFNFTAVDEALFKELAVVTALGVKRFKELNYIA